MKNNYLFLNRSGKKSNGSQKFGKHFVEKEESEQDLLERKQSEIKENLKKKKLQHLQEERRKI